MKPMCTFELVLATAQDMPCTGHAEVQHSKPQHPQAPVQHSHQHSTASHSTHSHVLWHPTPTLPVPNCRLSNTLLLLLVLPAVVQCVLEAVRLLLGVKSSVQVNGPVVNDPWRASQKMLLDPDFMDRIM